MMTSNNNKINGFQLVVLHFINGLKAIFTDSGALLILAGAVVIYPVVYSIGYYNETLTGMKIAVVDQDHSVASRKYAAMIDASPELEVAVKAPDLAAAKNLFMGNEVGGVILIPAGFQKEIMSGRQADVAVYADAGYFLKYRNLLLAATYANAYFSGGISVVRYIAEGKLPQNARVNQDPLPAYTHILYNPSSGYGSFVMPGVILVILQQTLLIGIGLMGGSFSESKASPFILPKQERTREIIPYLAGKTGTYLLVSLFNIAFAVVLVHHWFGYPDKANMLHVLMLLFPFLLSVIFMGIGLSTLFRHRESALVFMVFLSPIALFLSGLSWPVSSIPRWLVLLSKLLPVTTVVPAYLRLRTMGVGMAEVKTEVLFLYAQAAVYLALTLLYFFVRVKRKSRQEVAG